MQLAPSRMKTVHYSSAMDITKKALVGWGGVGWGRVCRDGSTTVYVLEWS